MEERDELHRRMKAGKSHGSQKISSPTFAVMVVGVEVTPLEKVKIKIILFSNVDFTRCRLSSETQYCNCCFNKSSKRKSYRITMGTGMKLRIFSKKFFFACKKPFKSLSLPVGK